MMELSSFTIGIGLILYDYLLMSFIFYKIPPSYKKKSLSKFNIILMIISSPVLIPDNVEES